MLEAEQNVIIFSFSLKITGGLKYPAARIQIISATLGHVRWKDG